MQTDWEIAGSEDLPLLGTAHAPPGPPRAVAIIVHGYKGYKDYGMFPALADHLARAGMVAHRFNLAHSGMTRDTATFARPDLFERDTWRHQADDIRRVVGAVRAGTIDGRGLPVFLVGHSRGGTASILAGVWHADELDLAAIATINAPATCCSLADDDRAALLRDGYLETASARTGQTLRVGAPWLREQLDDPQRHDPVAQAARTGCPVLLLHGSADETVPPASAERLAGAMGPRARVAIIEGANHVLDTPNPAPADAPPSSALQTAIDAVVGLVDANI